MPGALIWFRALPQWIRNAAYGLAIALLAVVLFLWWLHAHDRKVIDQHEAKIDAQVSEAVAQGSEAASQTVTETKTDVEAQNAKARDAAKGSDDPLKAGLEKLK